MIQRRYLRQLYGTLRIHLSIILYKEKTKGFNSISQRFWSLILGHVIYLSTILQNEKIKGLNSIVFQGLVHGSHHSWFRHTLKQRQRDSRFPETVFCCCLFVCLGITSSSQDITWDTQIPPNYQLQLENTKSSKFHILIQDVQCVSLSQILPVTER